MSFNFDLLRQLCQAPGISSREEQVRKIVLRELRPLMDSVSVDAMGNVIGWKNSGGHPRVMLAAHMDEIGFMVKFIDDAGFLRLLPVGGWDPTVIAAQRVHVHCVTGQMLLGTLMPQTSKAQLGAQKQQFEQMEIGDFFVDLGLPADRVRALVEIGDMVTMVRSTEQLGDAVVSKSLDNRLSVFVMIEALRASGAHQAEVVAVATTQEEVGLRGAMTAAYALQPDVGIAIDVTRANDIPGAVEHEQITRLGLGCALKIMDASSISHPVLVRHFREVAEKYDIPYQLEVMSRGGTDAGAIQRSRAGVPCFTLSIPTRYVHSTNEMAHSADIEAAIVLLARYVEEAHDGLYF